MYNKISTNLAQEAEAKKAGGAPSASAANGTANSPAAVVKS